MNDKWATEYIKARDARRGYSDEELRRAVENLKRYQPEHRFDDSLTEWDRDFLRVNRIKP